MVVGIMRERVDLGKNEGRPEVKKRFGEGSSDGRGRLMVTKRGEEWREGKVFEGEEEDGSRIVRNLTVASSSLSGTSQRSQTSAFTINAPNKGNFQRSQTSARCFKIIGYTIDFGKKKAGSNFNEKNVSNNSIRSSSSNGFSVEQMATLISLIKENYVNEKGVHSNMAGTYMNSSSMFNKNFEKFFCSNSSMNSKLASKGLITYLGVNQHMTHTDKNLVNVIDVSYLKIKVSYPNRIKAFSTKIGNMPLTNYLTLYDVLVMAKYCVSLISVHKVARDSKLVVAFDEMYSYVMNQDLRAGKILGTCKQIGGLYYFGGNQ
ncbi:hypothetical protein Tco_0786648, partial [Tanacetum coccineum]